MRNLAVNHALGGQHIGTTEFRKKNYSSRYTHYDNSRDAFVFGTTYFLSVAFGALYVYFKSYFRGASTAERIFASSITPFLWMTSGALLLTESHPLVEAFYWYLSPLNLALIFLVCLELGAATLIARKIHKSRGHEIKIITPAPIIVIAVSLFMLVGGYAWGSGENLFVLFLEGYRAIFGSGL